MDYKSKLVLELEDFSGIVWGGKHLSINQEYSLVEKKLDNTDLDKGIEDFVIVVERLEDHRFFQFEYSYSPYHELDASGLNDFPKTGYEVFPEIVSVTIYK